MFSSLEVRRLTSVSRFINQVAADLSGHESSGPGMQRYSVIVLLPQGVDPIDISDLLRYELSQRQVKTDLMTVVDHAHLPPLAGLSAHFRLPTVPPSCAELAQMAASALPEVLFLETLEQLNDDLLSAWVRLINQWAQVAHEHANHGKPFGALCLSVPAHCLSPLLTDQGALFQKVHYWWGLPTPAETQLLWHDIATRVADVHLTRWRNHILPSIAAGDMALLELLATCEGRTADIIACLEQLALQRGWTTEQLKQASGNQVVESGQRLSGGQQRPAAADVALWGMGALIWTPDYGTELHPAALLPLGLQHELDHRIWRAQAGLLLPIIDRIRRQLCGALTHLCAPDWAWCYAEPEDKQESALVRNNPMMCGLGHLAHLLHPKGVLQKYTRWHSLAAQARDLRNRIAHYQLVTLEEYLGLMHAMSHTSWRI